MYAIDASLDEAALLQKYTAKNTYLLVRGEIGVSWRDKRLVGIIRNLSISSIHVPLPCAKQIAVHSGNKTVLNTEKSMPPRYQVQLNTGKRLEPWVESVAAIKAGE